MGPKLKPALDALMPAICFSISVLTTPLRVTRPLSTITWMGQRLQRVPVQRRVAIDGARDLNAQTVVLIGQRQHLDLVADAGYARNITDQAFHVGLFKWLGDGAGQFHLPAVARGNSRRPR